MDEKHIGINYSTSQSWIGGKYYLDSIINELKKNPNNKIVFLKKPFLMRCIGKVFGKKSKLYRILLKKINVRANLDVVFPAVYGDFVAKKIIYWIPDFQENYYPEFFSIEDITRRMALQIRIAYSNDILVLSSESAKIDFERLFPKHTCEIFVLSFISSLAGKEISFIDTVSLYEKYNIKDSYFICSNQLWKHKNHIVVINAIEELKKRNIEVLCLFTGQETDYRNPEYPDYLKEIVREKKLQDNIKFLGFIPRNDQLSLMKNAIAVIQPSLFEGWNTTIEDAKVLDKVIIASDISVHREQLKKNGFMFNVSDYHELSKILEKLNNQSNTVQDYEYELQIKEYADKIKLLFD